MAHGQRASRVTASDGQGSPGSRFAPDHAPSGRRERAAARGRCRRLSSLSPGRACGAPPGRLTAPQPGMRPSAGPVRGAAAPAHTRRPRGIKPVPARHTLPALYPVDSAPGSRRPATQPPPGPQHLSALPPVGSLLMASPPARVRSPYWYDEMHNPCRCTTYRGRRCGACLARAHAQNLRILGFFSFVWLFILEMWMAWWALRICIAAAIVVDQLIKRRGMDLREAFAPWWRWQPRCWLHIRLVW